ncbi:MAG: hypothetical protein AAGD25_30365 [Cyanobacteria bacterium P01_F01_bin.150]
MGSSDVCILQAGIFVGVQNLLKNEGTDMTTPVQFGFTPAESEVWALRFGGHTPDTISRILNIEPRTVEIHLEQCLTKCQQHIDKDRMHRKGTTVQQDKAKSNLNRSQRKYAPVVFAPVPEFAAFYL